MILPLPTLWKRYTAFISQYPATSLLTEMTVMDLNLHLSIKIIMLTVLFLRRALKESTKMTVL